MQMKGNEHVELHSLYHFLFILQDFFAERRDLNVYIQSKYHRKRR